MAKRKTILKYILTTLWCCIGAGIIVLLVAAVKKEDKQKCKGVFITINGVSNNFFVDKQDIMQAINEYIDGSPVGKPVSILNLRALENDLQKNIWVKKAQLFFDNNTKLQVIVTEREPVARVFSTTGTTFYIDSSLTMLPLSDKFSARLPVFTGFPSDKMVLRRADSTLLGEVYQVSMAIQQDSFLMAMIDQVDITSQRTFEMMPKIGNTIIALGNGKDAAEKFEKLKLFYKEVIAKAGWNKYSMVDVQYKGQIVARIKDRKEIIADSMKTLQVMQIIAANAEKMANDSLMAMIQDNDRNTTDISIIEQSVQRDDEETEEEENASILKPQGIPVTDNPLDKPAPKKVEPVAKGKKAATLKAPAAVTKKPVVKPVIKPAESKPAAPKPINKTTTENKSKQVKPATQKPKAVMPAKNDY
jgi:cell division protein FtsQ